ncbi:MAG: hypothetical protein JWO86_4590 [Myxococcaceae bacterium]|nr:hypothetical protein [Myxococcaceae bacterium]
MLALQRLLAAAFGAIVFVLASDARASDAGCVVSGASCALVDMCCDAPQRECGAFDVDGGNACGFLGCKANGADCMPVTMLGETDPCCSGRCSPITRTCLAVGDPGPACVASGAACMSNGGQCCDGNEVCDYHASPTTMTCGARPPLPGDCAGDCGDGGAASSSDASNGSSGSSGSSGSNGALGGSSSSSGCACDLSGTDHPAWPAAALCSLGVAALFLRRRAQNRK